MTSWAVLMQSPIDRSTLQYKDDGLVMKLIQSVAPAEPAQVPHPLYNHSVALHNACLYGWLYRVSVVSLSVCSHLQTPENAHAC